MCATTPRSAGGASEGASRWTSHRGAWQNSRAFWHARARIPRSLNAPGMRRLRPRRAASTAPPCARHGATSRDVQTTCRRGSVAEGTERSCTKRTTLYNRAGAPRLSHTIQTSGAASLHRRDTEQHTQRSTKAQRGKSGHRRGPAGAVERPENTLTPHTGTLSLVFATRSTCKSMRHMAHPAAPSDGHARGRMPRATLAALTRSRTLAAQSNLATLSRRRRSLSSRW